MASIPGASSDPEEPVGAVLARLRRGRGLTGRELGELVGMSQPTISRIERGVGGPPDPRDVLRVATALGADEAEARRLMDRAERSHNRMTDWRTVPTALPSQGHSLQQQEAGSATFRIFQPAVVIGLLQTSQYARAVLSAIAEYQSVAGPDGTGPTEAAILEAVSARVRRQEVLADPKRSFRLVMMESVLGNRICPPEEMLAQIRRLREVAGQDNVDLRIVPADAALGVAPFHGFELVDDRMVIVDLFNTAISSFGRDDVGRYRRVFDEFEGEAISEIGPILDRYQRVYANLSMPGAVI